MMNLKSTFSQHISNQNNTSPSDGNYVNVYMLEETHTLYQDKYPPFVSYCNGKCNYQGNHKVIVLVNDDSHRQYI